MSKITAKLIDGKARAAALRAQVKQEVARLRDDGLTPTLVVVLVGADPASEVYVRNKARAAAETGMRSLESRLPEDTSQTELVQLVQRLDADHSVDGILVQLPLPAHLDARAVMAAISPAKDVDGFHVENVGRLAAGLPGLVPCTPLGCLMLLREAHPRGLAGLEAVVVGRSDIVGKPLAQLLIRESCTVTVAHSRTRDLPAVCRRADILVAAVGRPEMIRGDWIKPGATVIDVGINRVQGPEGSRLVGDVHFAEAEQVAARLTPVPGGVGPMTIACLLANTVTAACRRAGLRPPAGFGL